MDLGWHFVLTDLFGVPLGAIQQAEGPEIVVERHVPQTCSVTIRAPDPLADELVTREGRVLLKVYQDIGTALTSDVPATGAGSDVFPVTTTKGWAVHADNGFFRMGDEVIQYPVASLDATHFNALTRGGFTTPLAHKSGTKIMPIRFHGPCADYEEAEDGTQLKVVANFVSPFAVLAERMTGITADGTGLAHTATERGQILADILSEVNLELQATATPTAGFTGILVGHVASPMAKATTKAWAFKPASEVFTDMAATVAPQQYEVPPSVAASSAGDNFGPAGNIILQGTFDQQGDVWTEAAMPGAGSWYRRGGSGVFAAPFGSGAPYLSRITTDAFGVGDGVPGVRGRYAWVGPTKTDVAACVSIDRDGTMGSPPTVQGVAVRVDTTLGNALVFATVTGAFPGGQTHILFKLKTGAVTPIWTSAPGDVIYSGMGGGRLQIQVDATGDYALWWYPLVDGAPLSGPLLSGHDADLATGGALQSGQSGVYSLNSSPTVVTMAFDDFRAWTPVNRLSGEELEFECEPMEAYNIPGYYWPQIAQMNIAPNIGTDRSVGVSSSPVIFELDSSSMRSYNRKVKRIPGLLTRGYSLPAGVDPPWVSGAMKVAEASAEWTTEGLYEEVLPTTDINDAALRQAYVKLAVDLRKTAHQTIEFVPGPRAPVYGIDYFLGDWVTGRAKVRNPDGTWTTRFEGKFRVWGVTINRGPLGKMLGIPKLVPS